MKGIYIDITAASTDDMMVLLEAKKVAVAISESVNVKFDGFKVNVKPDSNIHDLTTIAHLERLKLKSNK